MSFEISAADELAHRAGATSAWSETWEFRAASPALDLGIHISVVRRPAERQMSYWSAVVGRGRPTVAVLEHEIAKPRRGLELRASGIWADHICETAHEHWSVGLEAFGLAFDDPSDAVTTGRGLSIPVGCDLEWETPEPPAPFSTAVDRGYVAVGVAHGDVLVGDDTFALDGPAQRLHRWGTGPAFPEWWGDSTASDHGAPTWSAFESVAVAKAGDAGGSVTEVRFGVAPGDRESGGPAWCSQGVEKSVGGIADRL